MNRLAEPIFTTRQTAILELPLGKNTRILHPEKVILQIGTHMFDMGAYCYAIRSDKRRKPCQPREVALGTLLKQRPKQVLQIIKALSRLITNDGKSAETIKTYVRSSFIPFIDWADSCGLHNCLLGGNATRVAYLAWIEATNERYHREEIGERCHNDRIRHTGEILAAITGIDDLLRSTRALKSCPRPNGTDPLAPHDFAHAVALSQAMFDGLCDLVLEQRPFPYKLVLPATLGWEGNHLWLFPTAIWNLPPHRWDAEKENRTTLSFAYDYKAGRVSTPAEIAHLYKRRFPSEQRMGAKVAIRSANALINTANADKKNRHRIMLAVIAHNAFMFLFLCNTGANQSVVREIETNGEIDSDTLNQKFRSIKYRAGSKPITLTVPASFMPTLRRFMELRRYLLDTKSFPYLFFALGTKNAKTPRRIGTSSIVSFVSKLRAIDPQLPTMAARKLRASVADWYQRHHDASITSKVLQNSEQTAQKYYDAGSATDHREEMTLYLKSVSESAKRQCVAHTKATDTQPLEEGGYCGSFGHPEALADNTPVKPDCSNGQGCLFCAHRVLIASEDDARKVASTAFVMEQVLLGPEHEKALRPLIVKCDEDLNKIADFGNCHAMVKRVRKDVFQNGNLTPFFADKFQLFLELGVIA